MAEDLDRWLAEFADSPRLLRQALRRVPPERLDARPAPGKWSAREIALHLCDTEISVAFRLKRALAEPGGTMPAFDQERWVDALAAFEDLPHALRTFGALRGQMTALLRRLPPDAWGRASVHPDLGPVRLDDWLRRFVSHTAGHIAQIRSLSGPGSAPAPYRPVP